MATIIEVGTDINIPNVDKQVNQFKELKKALIEAKSELAKLEEGTAEFTAQAANVGKIQDRINSLNDSIRSVSGAPIENLSSSFGLLSHQVRNVDFGGAATSLKQFGSSVSNIKIKDLSKEVKEFGGALLSVGKSILTNPIFLIGGIIVGIIAALVSLKDKVKIIGDAFDFLGGIISKVTHAIKDFTDSIGLTTFAIEDAAERQIAASKKAGDAIEERYDREIRYAKAAGKATLELERQKADAVKKNLLEQADAIAHLGAINGKFTDEQKKQLDEIRKKYKETVTSITVSEIEEIKRREDERKEAAKKALAERKKSEEEFASAVNKLYDEQEKTRERLAQEKLKAEEDFTKRKIEELAEQQRIAGEEFDIELRKINDRNELTKINNEYELQLLRGNNDEKLRVQLAQLNKERENRLQNIQYTGERSEIIEAEYASRKLQIEQDIAEEEKKLVDEVNEYRIRIFSEQLDALKGLSDTFSSNELAEFKRISQEKSNERQEEYNRQLQLARNNEELTNQIKERQANYEIKISNTLLQEENRIRKKQFDVDKAFSISRAVIDGIRSVQAALTIPPPFGQILAVSAGLVAAANVAKIAATKFDSKVSDVAPVSFSSVSFQEPSSDSSSQSGGGQGTKYYNPEGIRETNDLKVYVLESDIRNVAGRVDVMESRATFGK